MLSEYDEHETETEVGSGGGGDDGSGGGSSGGGAGGDEVVDDGRGEGIVGGFLGGCGSSTEPSIGLTPDDESPSLGTMEHDSFLFFLFLYPSFLLSAFLSIILLV